MEEATQLIDEHEQLTYPVLVDLYKHYWFVTHRYTKFSMTSISAIGQFRHVHQFLSAAGWEERRKQEHKYEHFD